MSSIFTFVEPTFPIERREMLIVPEGDRLESVQLLYYEQNKIIEGVCCSLQEYQTILRQFTEDGWSITQKSVTPIVAGYDSWMVNLVGIKKSLYEADGQFEFQVNT